MLRRLDLRSPWRSLDTDFWPESLSLGRRTVVYGHNGSGKSTLSELLLGLAGGACPTDLVWEDEDRKRIAVGTAGTGPSSMAVFTRKWVQANLSSFLDGENASAIVTLGREAIGAKEEQLELEGKIKRLTSDLNDAEKRRKAANGRVEKFSRELQDRIIAELQAFDYAHFTKHRYSIPRVQGDLREYEGDFPDISAYVEALKRLTEGAPEVVPEVPAPPSGVAGSLAGLSELLAETPTRVAIAALDGNPTAQTWVEHGLDLHEELNHCLFCTGEISLGRRNQLARHFDESWLHIRDKAKKLHNAVTLEKQDLIGWRSALPTTASLANELRPLYEDALHRADAEVGRRIGVLEAVEAVLDVKVADPSAKPVAPDCSLLANAFSVTELARAANKHNDLARRHAEVTAGRKATVLKYLVGSHAAAFRDLDAAANSCAEKERAARKAVDIAARRLNQVRQQRFSTKEMADTLTQDLARVYGKDHLSVEVTADGKSYACRRSGKPGTDLSAGERTTLSLLYFLRNLEDESVPGGDPSQRIVVIDDPSSSLDREALFATHQWLLDTLKDVGQYIVLTHDFGLLRLFIKSHKNAWGTSLNKIKKGNVDEMYFPKVNFLEIFATAVNGERRSRLGELPRLLLNHTSEYAYLFSMVMAGIADPEDHERLFLLPNAARRVIEVFASYKAPHRTDFLQQLEVLVQSQDGEPFRDVYDFCNRHSHGEGNESVDVLDARAVHAQIRRCMKFLRSVDREHFERMCTATNTDPTALR